jgi:DNA-binding XRE family transcriptional regulator
MAGGMNPSETGLGFCRWRLCPVRGTVFSVRQKAGAAVATTVNEPLQRQLQWFNHKYTRAGHNAKMSGIKTAPNASPLTLPLGSPVCLVPLHCGRYRFMRGMTQGQLADAIGLSFQQIQKYEKALNRITVSTLLDISNVFGIPIVLFWMGRRSA